MRSTTQKETIENIARFVGLGPRNLNEAIEKAKNDDDMETLKTPIQEEIITVTNDMLNNMIASGVATHVKMTEDEKRKVRRRVGKQVITVDEKE